MRISQLRGLAIAAFAALLLAGCASTEPDPAPVTEPEPAPTDINAEAEAAATETMKPMVERGKIVIPLSAMGGGAGAGSETLQGLFYFDYDQAIVKRAGHMELNKHAEVLAGDRGLRIRLEGHADERGTREYNLALGERRANAVRAYLVAQGAMRSQIDVISYGEEKPVDAGSSESSWAKNRRVEIVYR